MSFRHVDLVHNLRLHNGVIHEDRSILGDDGVFEVDGLQLGHRLGPLGWIKERCLLPLEHGPGQMAGIFYFVFLHRQVSVVDALGDFKSYPL